MSRVVCPRCSQEHPAGATCLRGHPKKERPGADAPAEPFGSTERVAVKAAPVEPPPSGPILGGKYQLGARIGAGGMGEVFRATHLTLGRVVAVKRLAPLLVDSEEARKRFVVEARSSACIDHPNIVTTTDIDYDAEHRPFFVMELVDGETLKKVLERDGAFPPARAVDVALQIADALTTAHRFVVHRDLKPANILLQTRRGADHVKILDFGIAKLVKGTREEALTQEGHLVGTIGYVAPEAASQTIERPELLDIYSLGVLLYELLSGNSPWSGCVTRQEMLSAQLVGPPPLRSRAPSCPAELEAIVARAMAVAPRDRYQSAEELYLALGAWRHDDEDMPIPAAAGEPMAVDALPVGFLFDTKYRVVRKLGQGGYGSVYLTRDVLVQRDCAVKILHLPDPEEKVRARFYRDAELAARIHHPHVVAVFGAGEWNGHPYIVLEYVSGSNLRTRWTTVTWAELADLVGQVADALAAIHAEGIVHRDLSPENILVDERLHAKITDFGIARPAGSNLTGSSTTHLLGRVGYMSPEQLLQQGVGPASDQWALGALIYEALVGSVPYADPAAGPLNADALSDIGAALQEGRPPALLRSRNGSVPAGLEEVLLRALAPDPSQRFPDIRAFASALAKYQDKPKPITLAVAAVPALTNGPSSTMMAWSKDATVDRPRRSPGKWVWVAAAAAAAIALGVYGVTSRRGDGHEPASRPSASIGAEQLVTQAPDAGPALGQIALEANVTGALATIGERTLTLPTALERPVGTHLSVKVEKDGLEPQTRELVFQATPATVRVELEVMPPATPATSATTSTPKRLPPPRPKVPPPLTDPHPQTDPDIYRRPDVIKKAPEPG